MKYKVKVTVIDKKLYQELQQAYCADPRAGACPCYNVGDEFIFERDGDRDDFWHMGLGHWLKPMLTLTLLQAARKCPTVLRRGMPLPVIFILDYRADRL